MYVTQQNRGSAKKPKLRWGRITAVLVLLLLIGGWLKLNSNEQKRLSPNQVLPDGQTLNASVGGRVKIFTHAEFRDLYRQIAYPNIVEILTPPPITGNAAADERIRFVATQRGYKLTAVPVSPIARIEGVYLSGDDLLQATAALAWEQLKQAADKEGVPLAIVSAYRSIDLQRQLFVGRLRAAGASNSAIAAKTADSLINETLESAAPPGYSRHHTGYTIDLACDKIGLHAFVKTRCFDWLSKDNYKNAKTYGWIPSYPEGADAQGPEAESWEYVWVGTNALTNK